MKIESFKNVVTSTVARQILISQKHSPTLLFAGGVLGVTGTVVLACRATLKLDKVLEKAETKHSEIDRALKIADPKRYSTRDAKRDRGIVKIHLAGDIAKLYAPPVALGVVSIAALTGSHVVLTKRNVALTAAYSALDKGFNEYRGRVRDALGEEKERDLRNSIYEGEIEVHDPKKGEIKHVKVRTPGSASIYARFFDELNENWNRHYEYNLMFLTMKQNYLNDRLHARGHMFLNEVYDELGMERSKAGAVVGWVISRDSGDNNIDFGLHNPENDKARDFVNGREPAFLVDFNVDGVIYDKIGRNK